MSREGHPTCTSSRHPRFLLPVAHLPLLLPGLQAQRLAEGAHQVSPRDQRGQLQLLALQLHLHLPLAAGEAHEPPQGHQGAGNVTAWRLKVHHTRVLNNGLIQCGRLNQVCTDNDLKMSQILKDVLSRPETA